MKSVADDRGSFTVEASIISIFIVAVIAKLIVLILYVHDICIIYEQVNRDMLYINKYIEKNVDNVIKEDSNYNKKILTILEKKESDFEKNINLLYVDIEKVAYTIKDIEICVRVKCRLDNNQGYQLYENGKIYDIERKMSYYDIKNEVRDMR